MNEYKGLRKCIATVLLTIQCASAQSELPPGIYPLDMALANAGQFVLQLNLNGALPEFPSLNNPTGQVDNGDPWYTLPLGSEVPYPFTLAFHFIDYDRSGMLHTATVSTPIYHVRVNKESSVSPWLLKEFWKIMGDIRTDLHIPPVEAQLLANKGISNPVYPKPPATDTAQPTHNNLKKITCPRCKGENEPMAACPLCGKRGYIWVESSSDK